MKAFAMLLVVMLFFVACKSENYKAPYNPKALTERDFREPADIQRQKLMGDSFNLESDSPEIERKFAPPKPRTEGAFDFSECEEKHGSDIENFRACVKAKYPNIKFTE